MFDFSLSLFRVFPEALGSSRYSQKARHGREGGMGCSFCELLHASKRDALKLRLIWR